MSMEERRPQHPKVTILTPVYNEEEGWVFYEQRVSEVLLNHKDYDFHVLFIDDGSTDESWQVITKICGRNPRFSGIRLSRNCGSHIALTAGFDHVDGDAMATLACDLQDPPEVILEFVEKWKEGAQIVWGKRRTREDDNWRILASALFYRLIRRYAMPRHSKFTTGSFLLVDRKVADCYRKFKEHNRITFALVAWTGFDQEVVEYDRKQRMSGKSGWTFAKMMKSMYDTFIGFSAAPIRLMTFLGIGFSLLTIPVSAYVLYNWFAHDTVPGWTGLMLTLTFFFGIQFLLMGISGEYLYRIYSESVRRPLYFISEKRTGETFKKEEI